MSQVHHAHGRAKGSGMSFMADPRRKDRRKPSGPLGIIEPAGETRHRALLVKRRRPSQNFGAADIKAANLRSAGISDADVQWSMMAAVRMAGVCEGNKAGCLTARSRARHPGGRGPVDGGFVRNSSEPHVRDWWAAPHGDCTTVAQTQSRRSERARQPD
jgi:hypothetical protein